MTHDQFNSLLKDRVLPIIEQRLSSKGEEYSGEGIDRLNQFWKIAEVCNSTPEETCCVLLLKHITAISDMVKRHPEKEEAEERIFDAICYLILLYTILFEKYDYSSE